MRRRIVSAVIGIILIASVSGAGETTSSPWRKPILSLPAAEFAEVEIDPGILAGSNGNLGAIRVTDEAGLAIPYVVAARPPRVEVTAIPILVVERTRGEGTLAFVIDRIKDQTPEQTIEIQVDGLTWRVPVVIELSRDRRHWVPFSRAEELQSTLTSPPLITGRIRFSSPDLRFIRVTLGPGLPDGAEFGRIALSRRAVRDEGEWMTCPVTASRSEVERDRDGATTVMHLDLGRPGLLHERATITLPEADYFRRIELRESDSDASNAAWRPLASGVVLRRSRTGETLARIEYPASRSRYLAVLIRHGDNRPVAGEITIEGLRRRIVVPTADQPRFVYYGDSVAHAPRYDLADRWTASKEKPTGAAMTLGAEEANPNFVAGPQGTFLERYPWVLSLGLLIGVIFLGAIAFGMMKEKPPEA